MFNPLPPVFLLSTCLHTDLFRCSPKNLFESPRSVPPRWRAFSWVSDTPPLQKFVRAFPLLSFCPFRSRNFSVPVFWSSSWRRLSQAPVRLFIKHPLSGLLLLPFLLFRPLMGFRFCRWREVTRRVSSLGFQTILSPSPSAPLFNAVFILSLRLDGASLYPT